MCHILIILANFKLFHYYFIVVIYVIYFIVVIYVVILVIYDQ